MKKRQSMFTAAGIPSLVLIFSVLCMVVLSLLALGSSRSDLKTSRLSMELTEGYYRACSEATDVCLDIQELAQQIYSQTSHETDYFAKLEEVLENDSRFFYDSSSRELRFEISVSDNLKLQVVLKTVFPDSSDQKNVFSVLTWKTVVSGDWEPDMHQPVYQPDK